VILQNIAEMEMPPPYNDLAKLDTEFKNRLKKLIAVTAKFSEDILEIVNCSSVHGIGQSDIIKKSYLIATNIRLIFMYKTDQNNTRDNIRVISALLTEITSVELKPDFSRLASIEFVCTTNKYDSFSVTISKDIITRIMIVLKLYAVPILLVKVRDQRTLFSYFEKTTAFIFFFFLLLFFRSHFQMSETFLLAPFLAFITVVICYTPIILYRFFHTEVNAFSETKHVKKRFLWSSVISFALISFSIFTMLFFLYTKNSYYLDYQNQSLAIKHGLVAASFLKSKITYFKIRLNKKDIAFKQPRELDKGVQLKKWRRKGINDELVNLLKEWVINKNKKKLLLKKIDILNQKNK